MRVFTVILLSFLIVGPALAEVEIIPITHGSLILRWQGKTIHVDPWSKGNYEGQPLADLVLITDIHGDHMDPVQARKVRKDNSLTIAPAAVQATIPEAVAIKNGQTRVAFGIRIEAVPMYNNSRGPEPGKLYHPKGRGNGYILTLGEDRVYISGDTACTSEMKALRDIDYAFVCMNLPYTMTPQEAAECVNAFKPAVVIPYHYRDSDLDAFKQAVTAPGVEVRLLKWY